MSAPDVPALRPDGTLKEASELEWIHSPSAENKSLLPTLTDPIVNNIDGNYSQTLPCIRIRLAHIISSGSPVRTSSGTELNRWNQF